MMAALGRCGDLGASTFVLLNELTTVGAVAALYPYLSGYASLGAADSNALAMAFATAQEYSWIAGGTVPGQTLPAGYYASSVEIATLANILATCVNTAGGVAGDGSPCGNLFSLATPSGGVAPTDVLQAALDIVENPTHNVGSIYNLEPARGAPFQPSLSAAPTDWTLPILPIPATPTFSEAAGTYRGDQTITVNESVPGATVYYTLDGTTPTVSSTVYSGSITVQSPTTLSAMAMYGGRTASGVASARYLVAPAADPSPVGSVATQSSNGIPNSVVAWGNFEFVTVQGTGQIFTYDLSTGYQLLAVPAYRAPCNSPSGMAVTQIGGQTVMAVVCYDTNSLLTLAVAGDGSLSALGSVSGLPVPYPGIALVGTDVYVPLHGGVNASNGGVAKVSLAVPSSPVVTATGSLVSPQPGEYDNAAYLVESGGYLYITAGSESAPADISSTIQVMRTDTMAVVGAPFVVEHSPQQITKAGDVLYVTIYDQQQVVSINAHDPANLAVIETLTINTAPTDCSGEPILASGSTLYVGCYGQNNLLRLDISNPSAMVTTGSVQVVSPQRMVLSGTALLVTNGTYNGQVTRIDTGTAF
jgi:hypothetical protein